MSTLMNKLKTYCRKKKSGILLMVLMLPIYVLLIIPLFRTKLDIRVLNLDGEPIRISDSMEAGREFLCQIDVKAISSEKDPILSLEIDRNIRLIPDSMFLEDSTRTRKQIDDSAIGQGVRLRAYSKDREVRIHVRAKTVKDDLYSESRNLLIKAVLKNGEDLLESSCSVWSSAKKN